jgi:hypothetical protein
MNQTASYIVEMTVVAIVLGWVITRNRDFATVIGASTSAITGSVQALQGR